MPMYKVYFAVVEGDRLDTLMEDIEAESLEKAEEQARIKYTQVVGEHPFTFTVGEEGHVRSHLTSESGILRSEF